MIEKSAKQDTKIISVHWSVFKSSISYRTLSYQICLLSKLSCDQSNDSKLATCQSTAVLALWLDNKPECTLLDLSNHCLPLKNSLVCQRLLQLFFWYVRRANVFWKSTKSMLLVDFLACHQVAIECNNFFCPYQISKQANCLDWYRFVQSTWHEAMAPLWSCHIWSPCTAMFTAAALLCAATLSPLSAATSLGQINCHRSCCFGDWFGCFWWPSIVMVSFSVAAAAAA